MPGWRDELPLLRASALQFALALALAVALLSGAAGKLVERQHELVQATALRDQAHGRYRDVESEIQDIRNFQPTYLLLQQAGLIGQERRLDWIESIKRIQRERQLLPITYEIEPQRPFADAPENDLGGFQLRGSKMSVQMDLLHELDLFRFLDDLRGQNFVAIERCRIQRNVAMAETPLAPRLSAACSLHWYTMDLPAPPVRLEQP